MLFTDLKKEMIYYINNAQTNYEYFSVVLDYYNKILGFCSKFYISNNKIEPKDQDVKNFIQYVLGEIEHKIDKSTIYKEKLKLEFVKNLLVKYIPENELLPKIEQLDLINRYDFKKDKKIKMPKVVGFQELSQ
jgi:hypothetical protein